MWHNTGCPRKILQGQTVLVWSEQKVIATLKPPLLSHMNSWLSNAVYLSQFGCWNPEILLFSKISQDNTKCASFRECDSNSTLIGFIDLYKWIQLNRRGHNYVILYFVRGNNYVILYFVCVTHIYELILYVR